MINVRQQVKQMTNKRSRSSFYFWEQDLFFFEALRCHQRLTDDQQQTTDQRTMTTTDDRRPLAGEGDDQ